MQLNLHCDVLINYDVTTVYSDDTMKCNTVDPGCEAMCYDEYARPSMFTIWAYQVLSQYFFV